MLICLNPFWIFEFWITLFNGQISEIMKFEMMEGELLFLTESFAFLTGNGRNLKFWVLKFPQTNIALLTGVLLPTEFHLGNDVFLNFIVMDLCFWCDLHNPIHIRYNHVFCQMIYLIMMGPTSIGVKSREMLYTRLSCLFWAVWILNMWPLMLSSTQLWISLIQSFGGFRLYLTLFDQTL